MDKKIKLIRYFLKYLSNKSKFKQISFENFRTYANNLGFKDFTYNYSLFNFYNENVSAVVDWDSFSDEQIKKFTRSFKNKIELTSSGLSDDEIFTKEELISSDKHFEVFLRSYDMRIDFKRPYNNDFFDMLNTDYESISYYESAKQGYSGYEPEYSRDEIHWFFNRLNDDNRKLIRKLLIYGGRSDLANKFTSEFNEEIIDKIIKLLENLYGEYNIIEDMFKEYSHLVRQASNESVEDAFEEHIPSGINYIDSTTFFVEYDYFLEYLDKHPDVNSFDDMLKYPLIEDSLYNLYEASYEYDLDMNQLQYEFEKIFENVIDNVESDEKFQEKIKNIEELEDILYRLNFKMDGDQYHKILKDEKFFNEAKRRFIIPINKIDYDSKMLVLKILYFDDPEKNSRIYKIPFDELADYVFTEKLYESVLFQINRYLLKN